MLSLQCYVIFSISLAQLFPCQVYVTSMLQMQPTFCSFRQTFYLLSCSSLCSYFFVLLSCHLLFAFNAPWYLPYVLLTNWRINLSMFTSIKPFLMPARSHTPSNKQHVTLLVSFPLASQHSPRLPILHLHYDVTEFKLITQLRTIQQNLNSGR